MANSLVEVGIPATGTFYLELYPAAGGAIANGASGDDEVVRDGDNASRGVATVTQELTGVHKYKLVDSSGNMIAFGETEPLIDDTRLYKCHDWLPTTLQGTAEALARIEAKTSQITSGTVIEVLGAVTAAGQVTMIKGSDYQKSAGTAIPIPVADIGGALHGVLIDPLQVASIVFGGGSESAGPNQVTGTVGQVTGVDLIYLDDVTTIMVESFAANSQYADPSVDYLWHIKAINPSGFEVVELAGSLILQGEIAAPPHL